MTVTLQTEECDKCSLLPLMCEKTVNQPPKGLAGGQVPTGEATVRPPNNAADCHC